jgi:hypothetical protein
MSQDRLDELVAALASTRPVLDDITRARVAAGIAAASRTPQPVRRNPRRRWMIGGAAAAIVVLAIGLALHDTSAPGPELAVAPMVVVGELPEGAMLAAVPGTAVQGQIAGTVVTVYGPGSATRRGSRIVVDADRLVVDRPGGDAPVELEVRTATIRVQHATFSVDSGHALRVTVIRGEIILTCADHGADQAVTAGGSAACDATRTAVGAPAAARPPSPNRLVTEVSPASGAVPSDMSSSSPPPTIPDVRSRAPRAVTGDAPLPTARTTASARPPRPATTAAPPPRSPATPSAIAADTRPIATEQTTEHAPPEPAEPAGSPDSPGQSSVAPAGTAARYAAVEHLMTRDPAAARAALRALVTEAPTAPEVAPALLDLARLAAGAGDDVAAHAALDQLAAHPGAAPLAMPAMYLRCTLEQTDPGRRSCLAGFRAAFPDSPRDAEVLSHLAAATAGTGDCDVALGLLVELKRRYPKASTTAGVRAWNSRCKSPVAR